MNSVENIINSVVEITSHNKEYVMAKSLVTTINALLDVDLIFLVEAIRSEVKGIVEVRTSVVGFAGAEFGNAPNDETSLSPETAKVFNPLINLCLEKHGRQGKRDRQFLQKSDFSACTFPILGEDGVSYVLCLKHQSLSEGDVRIVEGMVQIFCNYLLILSEGKRDTLTGLLNRRVFLEKINRIIRASHYEPEEFNAGIDRRQDNTEGSYWLAIFDIDHFKNINDTYGHIYGDEVLIMFSTLMREYFRSTDLLFRYGGEEFVAVIGTMTEEVAMTVFERFRNKIAEKQFGQLDRVTVSIGMVEILQGNDPTTLVGRADQALYYAKDHGRNQLAVYEHLLEQGAISIPSTQDDLEIF